MNIEIANKLLRLRKEKGLSQEQLAQKLGISRQAISKWERAEASPDTDNLIELAKLYDISLDELLLHEPSSKEKNDNEETKDNYTHVGFDGIHVKDHKGDEVHVSWDGIHVNENGGHAVDVSKEGVFIDGKEHHKEDWMYWKDENRKNSFPFGAILFFGVLIYAFLTNQWESIWIILITIPTFESLMSALRQRKFSKFAYPLLCTIIYLWVGIYYGYWHPFWIIYLTIPCYYSIAHYLDHRRTS
ncbi:MAG: helix-turn-helix domain-containing protein [Coprobacillus sp.]|nr:helix-turn-helix domain-containing protein [Coprobacillus sp.]